MDAATNTVNQAVQAVDQGLAAAAKSLGLGEALGLSLLGFLIVFFVLIVLMLVIRVLRNAVEQMGPAPAAAAAGAGVQALAAAPDPNAGKVPAKGSLGDVRLHTVDDRTAALLMAIVADEMKAPLNELRFISIREIEK